MKPYKVPINIVMEIDHEYFTVENKVIIYAESEEDALEKAKHALEVTVHPGQPTEIAPGNALYGEDKIVHCYDKPEIK